MGTVATTSTARHMRNILIERGHWLEDVSDIEAGEWHDCLEAAGRFAQEDMVPDTSRLTS